MRMQEEKLCKKMGGAYANYVRHNAWRWDLTTKWHTTWLASTTFPHEYLCTCINMTLQQTLFCLMSKNCPH